ncbi:GM20583 [Drosophila sechellia]|uniref:GM20583 n=1 Tax=Drosophila sechellia TaxID=7238 RepID=B4HT35_DROSE|nr:GM20583 [Drosophila sechellia]
MAASLFALDSAQNFKARPPAMVHGYGTGLPSQSSDWDWDRRSCENTFRNHTPLSGHVRIKWLDLAGVLFICLCLCCRRRRVTESAAVEWSGVDMASVWTPLGEWEWQRERKGG